MAAAGSTCTTARIPRGKGLLTPEMMPAYEERALSLAATFADLDIDCVDDVEQLGCIRSDAVADR